MVERAIITNPRHLQRIVAGSGHEFSLSASIIADESTTKYSTFENDMVSAVQKVRNAVSNPTENSKINRGGEEWTTGLARNPKIRE